MIPLTIEAGVPAYANNRATRNPAIVGGAPIRQRTRRSENPSRNASIELIMCEGHQVTGYAGWANP